MLNYDFEESIGYWLLTAARAYQRTFNDNVAPHGITYRQCQVLGYLVMEGPLTQNALAERMRIEPPTLVGILDRMERDGWIRRDECEQDRRKKLIHYTEAAEPIWSQIVACGREVRAQSTRGMSDEEIATLKSLLSRLERNLNQPSPRNSGELLPTS